MLSRVADSIYWMARYMERAENTARLLVSTRDLLLDAGSEGTSQERLWGAILSATGDEEGYFALYRRIKGRDVASYLTLSRENPNSIVGNVQAARENARTVRDQISDELWECINGLKIWFESVAGRAESRNQTVAFHERVLLGCYHFQGVAASTTPRGESWHFLRLGTCLERADQTSRLLDTCSGLSREMPPHPDAQPLRWAALLRSCSAWHAFQTRSSKLDPCKIAEYLLLDETFPRSVAYCVREVKSALRSLYGHEIRGAAMPDPVRRAGRLHADLAYAEIGEILERGLHDYIDDLQTRMIRIGDSIFRAFVLYADLTPVGVPEMIAGPLSNVSGGDFAEHQSQQ
ncbi:MAG: alpha-E domain-containing protein [Chthoniobacterales bacterium]|nr:alpha-E domain-containing protein [Chthoniobacterales bacterium]